MNGLYGHCGLTGREGRSVEGAGVEGEEIGKEIWVRVWIERKIREMVGRIRSQSLRCTKRRTPVTPGPLPALCVARHGETPTAKRFRPLLEETDDP